MSDIPDYQVEAAQKELRQNKWINKWGSDEAVKAALQAARDAKPPEDVVVTEEMFNAGYEAMNNSRGPTALCGDVRAIYAAMHRAAPKVERRIVDDRRKFVSISGTGFSGPYYFVREDSLHICRRKTPRRKGTPA